MNRKQKRDALKNEQNLNLTLRVMAEAERKQATMNAIVNLSAVFAITLHDKFGFGKDRINKLLDNVMNQIDCCNANTVSMNDILKWVLDYGIKIEIPGKGQVTL